MSGLAASAAPVVWRTGWVPGLAGELLRWHGWYYVRDHGWPARFEAVVARELAELMLAADHPDVHAWSAWRGDEFLAGLALDGRDASGAGARLRFFIASDAGRGLGLGHHLMQTVSQCADARGYPRVWLTTVAGLEAAAHLYRTHGYVLVDEHLDTSWGAPMREQRHVRMPPGCTNPTNPSTAEAP